MGPWVCALLGAGLALAPRDATAATALDVYRQNLARGATAEPGVVGVRSRPGTPEAWLGAHPGCRIAARWGRGVMLLACGSERPLEERIDALGADPDVLWVEASFYEQGGGEEGAEILIPDDLDETAWHHRNLGQLIEGEPGLRGADLGSPVAWAQTLGSGAFPIGLVDVGIDAAHPDLGGRIWKNPAEICGDGVDQDADGWVDDCAGWDFGDEDPDPSPFALPEKAKDGTPCRPWHATGLAGLAAAVGNNGQGVAGVGWGLTVIDTKRVPDATCQGSSLRSAMAASYAVERGARVLLLAFSSNAYSAFFEEVLQDAEAGGVLVVMSAGNTGSDVDDLEHPRYPNHYALAHPLTVAATDPRDALAADSNWGSTRVHLAAPGEALVTTDLLAGYRTVSGTSYAAALVAGAAALCWSAHPALSMPELREALLAGASPIATLACASTQRCVASGARLFLPGALDAAEELERVGRRVAPEPGPAEEPEASPGPEPAEVPGADPATAPSRVPEGPEAPVAAVEAGKPPGGCAGGGLGARGLPWYWLAVLCRRRDQAGRRRKPVTIAGTIASVGRMGRVLPMIVERPTRSG